MARRKRGLQLLRTLLLRPYGEQLLSDGARFWLSAARTLVAVMALVEGVSWGYIGTLLAKDDNSVVAGLAVGLVVALVVWWLDVSLVTLDQSRAFYARKLYNRSIDSSWLNPFKTWGGIAVRVGVVTVSLSITAPFIAQLVFRADIEKALEGRRSTLIGQTRANISAHFAAELGKVERQLRELQSLAEQNTQAARAKTQTLLEQARLDLASAQRDYEKEIAGQLRTGTLQRGDGPTAKAILKRIARIEVDIALYRKTLAAPPSDQSALPIFDRLKEAQLRRAELDSERESELGRFERAVEMDDLKELENRWGLVLPSNSLGAQKTLLASLKYQPVFVETELAIRAFLAIIFMVFLSLKLFEPRSVKIYLSEALQDEWQRYKKGEFDDWLSESDRPNEEQPPMPPHRFEDMMVRVYHDVLVSDYATKSTATLNSVMREKTERLEEIERGIAAGWQSARERLSVIVSSFDETRRQLYDAESESEALGKRLEQATRDYKNAESRASNPTSVRHHRLLAALEDELVATQRQLDRSNSTQESLKGTLEQMGTEKTQVERVLKSLDEQLTQARDAVGLVRERWIRKTSEFSGTKPGGV